MPRLIRGIGICHQSGCLAFRHTDRLRRDNLLHALTGLLCELLCARNHGFELLFDLLRMHMLERIPTDCRRFLGKPRDPFLITGKARQSVFQRAAFSFEKMGQRNDGFSRSKEVRA